MKKIHSNSDFIAVVMMKHSIASYCYAIVLDLISAVVVIAGDLSVEALLVADCSDTTAKPVRNEVELRSLLDSQ